MLVKLARILALVSCVSLIACKEYKVREIKDFRLYVKSENTAHKAAIQEMAAQFNRDVGTDALKIVDDASTANSMITYVPNLKNEKGEKKLALGQWVTAETQKSYLRASGAKEEVTIVHSMNIEFDLQNFDQMLPKFADKTSPEYQHLYRLFCHEVGHGMQLDHVEDENSVMFEVVPYKRPTNVNFDPFFSYVRSYLNVVPSEKVADLI